MAETSIEWTDFTVNFWWGCTKVGPGCDYCYAETWDKRTGGAHWGPHAERRRIKGAAASLRKINDMAPEYHFVHGRYPRVFMHSMSDLFDNAVPYLWRAEALAAAELVDQTRIQMVTKRIGNVEEMVNQVWLVWPRHIGLMITVCNQAEADRDIPKLLDLKSRLGIPWVGLSIEPMLGPIDLMTIGRPSPLGSMSALPCEPGGTYVDWVICGGESGPHARPMHPDWARSLRDQCVAAGVPFFFKQWGNWDASALLYTDIQGRCPPPNMNIGKKAAGRLLDGRTWDEVPA